MGYRLAVAAAMLLALPLAADGYQDPAARERGTLIAAFGGLRPAALRIKACRAVDPWLRLRQTSGPKQKASFDTRTSI
jgi:hypothetical protein